MCLAVPGKIISIDYTEPFVMAQVDFIGVKREVCLNAVDAQVGDYVIVHAGVALSKLDPNEAMDTIDDLEKITKYDEQRNR